MVDGGSVGGDVRVVFTKYDGSLHWHETMIRLGEDEHGIWLGAPSGTQTRKGDGPVITLREAHVMLVRPLVWWTAVFNARPQRVEIYCDVTTPVSWPEPDQVTMVDLDLDVVRARARLLPPRLSQVKVLDEDEFAEHRVRYGYPENVIAEAQAATAWLAGALGDGTEPFATRYRTWLSRVT